MSVCAGDVTTHGFTPGSAPQGVSVIGSAGGFVVPCGTDVQVSRFHDVQRPDDQSGNRSRDRET
jgi:hypothetical protein